MGGVIQIFFSLRVRHACRVPSNDVEVCSSDHPGSTVPLDLIGGGWHAPQEEAVVKPSRSWNCPLPLWAQRTSSVRERLPQWCWQGPGRPPPRQQRAVSSASPRARHRLWSSRQAGAAGGRGFCSHAPADAAWCPASAGRGHCGRDYAAGRRRLHLRRRKWRQTFDKYFTTLCMR